MTVSIHSLTYQADTPTLFLTIPFNGVVCSKSSPFITLYIPSRLSNANVYDTNVGKISIPWITLFPTSGPVDNLVPLTDRISVCKDEDPSILTAGHTGILLHVTSPTSIDIYKGISGATWQVIANAVSVVSTTVYEERLLPICITQPTVKAYELAVDCRQSGQLLEGQCLRTSSTSLRIPVIVQSGTNYGNVVIDPSIVDLDTIERVFLTDTLSTDMFPLSSQGKYLILYQFVLSSVPYVTLMYGANQDIQSQALEVTDVSSVVFGAVDGTALSSITDFTLQVDGGRDELNQRTLHSVTYYPSKADPYIEYVFTIDSVTGTVNDHTYIVVALHQSQGETHVSYPGLHTNTTAINLVLNVDAVTMLVTMSDDTSIGSCVDGCALPTGTVVGDWKVRIITSNISSLMYVTHNDILIDVITIPVTRKQLFKPSTLTWYLNGVGDTCAVNVSGIGATNSVPFQTEPSMCITSSLSAGITPCMETQDILALIDYDTYANFETETVGLVSAAHIVPATPVSNTTWMIANAETTTQIITPGLVTNSTQCLYLPNRATLIAFNNVDTYPCSAVSLRMFVQLTSTSATDVISIEFKSANVNINFRRIVVKANGNNGWYINTTSQPQSLATAETITTNKLGTPAIQAGIVYCLVLVVTPTELTLHVNGVQYTTTTHLTNNRLFTPGINAASPPVNELMVVLSTTIAQYVDDIILKWNEGFSALTATALNNAPQTRLTTLNCDFTQMTTDITRQPVTSREVVSNYGGIVKSTKVNSYFLPADSNTQVYSIPPQFAFAVVDISLAASAIGSVTIKFGALDTQVLDVVSVGLDNVLIRGVRLSRGMGLIMYTDVDVSVRITALLG